MGTVTSAAAPVQEPRRSSPPGRLSDELLARQVGRGSERAFAALYERYHQPLYGYCHSIIRNDADAQDVLQSTFTAALSALQRERRNAPLRPWLYRIAHNEAISLLRRRSRESDQEINEARAPTVSSAEDEAAGRARWSTLVADLGRLPERQRSALVLRELSGLSHEEIAIALGTNVGGAKQAIFEARQGLLELAEGRAMTCEEVRLRLSAGDRRVLRGRRVRAHLRDCSGCDAFAAAIPERRAQLRALTPALPSSAAAAVLARTLGSGPAVHSGAGATAGTAAATAGAVGKAAGTAVAWKALTGVALIATAAAGVTGIEHAVGARHASSQAARAGSRPAAATADRDTIVSGGATRRQYRVAVGPHRGVSRALSPAVAVAVTATPSQAAASSHGSTVAASRSRGQGSLSAVGRGHSPSAHGHVVGHTHATPQHGRSSTPHTKTGPQRKNAAAHKRPSVRPTATAPARTHPPHASRLARIIRLVSDRS